ncbi:chloride channel CLIC-like protein 1 [Aquarana catesbeiana]|uniref:chloride channel CLIC-like protein 1 n=1 Tax=Aquarana catesbeiana TaxID=8400 RepID=UPI003CC9AE56
MEFIYSWILSRVVGLPEDEPHLPPLWSLESPFKQWTMYSKAMLASSFICFLVFLILQICKRTPVTSKAMVRKLSAAPLEDVCIPQRPLLDRWLHYFVLLLVISLFISIPWEWFRLYKIEVAKKMRILSEGYARSCYQADLSFWETMKIWFSWNFSWDIGSCESYYKALMVDPFWEVNPLMAISSVVWRLVFHPVELFSLAIGRSLRNIMKEIPSQWQLPVFLLLSLICISVLVAAYTKRKNPTAEPHRTRPAIIGPNSVQGAETSTTVTTLRKNKRTKSTE